MGKYKHQRNTLLVKYRTLNVQNTEFKKVVQDRGNRGEESISEAEKEMVKR